MRAYIVAAALLASFATSPVTAQSDYSSASTSVSKYSTAETEIGTLLDDPAARAILDKHMPDFASNPQIDMARGMTLKGIQSYAPDITDAVLAAIDADLAALAKKKL